MGHRELVTEYLDSHIITEDMPNDDIIASVVFWRNLPDMPVPEVRELVYEIMTIIGRTPRADKTASTADGEA